MRKLQELQERASSFWAVMPRAVLAGILALVILDGFWIAWNAYYRSNPWRLLSTTTRVLSPGVGAIRRWCVFSSVATVILPPLIVSRFLRGGRRFRGAAMIGAGALQLVAVFFAAMIVVSSNRHTFLSPTWCVDGPEADLCGYERPNVTTFLIIPHGVFWSLNAPSGACKGFGDNVDDATWDDSKGGFRLVRHDGAVVEATNGAVGIMYPSDCICRVSMATRQGLKGYLRNKGLTPLCDKRPAGR